MIAISAWNALKTAESPVSVTDFWLSSFVVICFLLPYVRCVFSVVWATCFFSLFGAVAYDAVAYDAVAYDAVAYNEICGCCFL